MKKELYQTPETELINVSPEGHLLAGSGEDLGKDTPTFVWE